MSLLKEQEPTIYDRINLIMKEVGGIEKDRDNKSQGYKFRGIDDVYLKLQPLLAKHGVFTTLEVLDDHRTEKPSKNGGVLFYTTLKIRYDFWALDGSKVSCIVIGEAMDSGDKASNKAMSVAQKYAFIQIFAIPTQEPKDPEVDSPEVAADWPETSKTITTAPLDKPEEPKAKTTTKKAAASGCDHKWLKSKFPNKVTGEQEEWCTKCKLTRPFI